MATLPPNPFALSVPAASAVVADAEEDTAETLTSVPAATGPLDRMKASVPIGASVRLTIGIVSGRRRQRRRRSAAGQRGERNGGGRDNVAAVRCLGAPTRLLRDLDEQVSRRHIADRRPVGRRQGPGDDTVRRVGGDVKAARGCDRRRAVDERLGLVRQANWQKVGGASPPERRSNRTTFLREPCVGSREGAGEASVAAWMGRAIEHRKSDGPGCRGFQIGRRQYCRRRFGEMSASPAVSENPCTFARLLLGPWEVFKLPRLS